METILQQLEKQLTNIFPQGRKEQRHLSSRIRRAYGCFDPTNYQLRALRGQRNNSNE
jgi:hypothetical protein